MTSRYIEVGYHQIEKGKQRVSGDTFLIKKISASGKVVAVLADGLGSGIKASVLSTLTTTMAARFAADLEDIKRWGSVILRTLPVCRVRKIGYSTFTIAVFSEEGFIQLVEYGNPLASFFRGSNWEPIDRQTVTIDGQRGEFYFSRWRAEVGDRLLFYSDGVSQSGMGEESFPFGWGDLNVQKYSEKLLTEQKGKNLISAADLSKMIAEQALRNDRFNARDDITCASIYLREPRRTLVLTGAPYHRDRDSKLADITCSYVGKKVICGGTTANILSRELNRQLSFVPQKQIHLPPTSTLEGFDLITEGTMTLAAALKILEDRQQPMSFLRRTQWGAFGPAEQLISVWLDSDQIDFFVGSRINEAHQDPDIPQTLEFRRNLVQRICVVLERDYLKRVKVKYL